MRAFVGLGNPGKEYEMTRHNMGFIVLKKLAHDLGTSFRKDERFEGWRTKADTVELFLPATYMNESGRAVQKLVHYFQIAPSKILAVVDDMDLPFGQMRLKAFGGSGGHNGLKSMERELGTNHFARLRIGIGRVSGASQVDHVLGKFSQEEQELLGGIVDDAVACLKKLMTEEFSKVANVVNQRSVTTKEDV